MYANINISAHHPIWVYDFLNGGWILICFDGTYLN